MFTPRLTDIEPIRHDLIFKKFLANDARHHQGVVMNRRSFLNLLGYLPLVGLLVPKAGAEQVERQIVAVNDLPEVVLPHHFPKNLVTIDPEGVAHPVPVLLVDDINKYPEECFSQTHEPGLVAFRVQLPLVVLSRDGTVIGCFCFFHEDFQQIVSQLMMHYNQTIDSIADNRLALQEVAWPNHFWSGAFPEGLRIMRWRMYLRQGRHPCEGWMPFCGS